MRKMIFYFLIGLFSIGVLAGCAQSNTLSSAAEETPLGGTERASTTSDSREPTSDPEAAFERELLAPSGGEAESVSDADKGFGDTDVMEGSDISSSLEEGVGEAINDISETDIGISEHFLTAEEIQLGEVVQGKESCVVFESAYLTKQVLPDIQDGAYSFLDEMEGYSYLVCKGTLENQSDRQFETEYTSILGDTPYILLGRYGDSYYLGRILAETASLDNITTSIESGESVPFFGVFTIPTEKIEEGIGAEILLGYDDFSSAIYKAGFGNPEIDWESCSTLVKISFEQIRENMQ